MIRPAKPTDAEEVVPLIIQAMGPLAHKLTNIEDDELINATFTHFFKLEGNQYSYGIPWFLKKKAKYWDP
ncbi:hypothetical protein [Pedobacter psychrodurus]|uniref:hypothetical protein n=1 Tax=Pedobacter psychrodurus TaxID=2530456 RepID=UPI00292DAFC3|nr:hypothetical protein [Pedobacter psychrodurus]